MVNYQDGKIYRIDGGGLTYVGSTTNKYLSTRLAKHKNHYKRYLDGKSENYYTSFEIIKTGEYKIELIEMFPCNSKDELNAREGHYIRQMDCVNALIAGRTKKEWYENNKEHVVAQKKQYRENNKQAISTRANQKHTCECGGRYTNRNKSTHLKSLKHLNYLKEVKE